MANSVADLCQDGRGWTLEGLTQACGLEASRVAAIVEGRWTPTPTERAKIAAVFNVPVSEVAWGHKTPIQHLWGHGPG